MLTNHFKIWILEKIAIFIRFSLLLMNKLSWFIWKSIFVIHSHHIEGIWISFGLIFFIILKCFFKLDVTALCWPSVFRFNHRNIILKEFFHSISNMFNFYDVRVFKFWRTFPQGGIYCQGVTKTWLDSIARSSAFVVRWGFM